MIGINKGITEGRKQNSTEAKILIERVQSIIEIAPTLRFCLLNLSNNNLNFHSSLHLARKR
jgi:hypothetical protein